MGFLLAALAGGFLFFQTQATPQKAAAKLETALRRKFPDAKVKVEVQGKRGLDVVSGKYGLVRVRMEGFRASGTTVSLYAVPSARKAGHFGKAILELRDFGFETTRIDEADIEVNDIVYDWNALKKRGQLGIVSAGPGSSRILLGEKSLEGIVKLRLPQIQNPSLRLGGGLLHLSGSRAAPIIGTPIHFSLTAKPVARGGELWMEDMHMSLGGATLPSFISNGLLSDLNPAFVFDRDGKWPFRIVSSNVVMHEKALELFGSLAFVPAQKPGDKTASKTPTQAAPQVR